jgi:hypothetical protein
MRHLVLVLALLGSAAAAQPQPSQGEIVFWESIRNSTDAADFRAYLEQYPQGTYAALARNRIAALGQKPAAAPEAPPSAPAAKAESRLPSEGDAWTYRLSEPGAAQRTYSVKVSSVSPAAIVEQYAIEGGPSAEWTHKGEREVVTLGKSVFAPYLMSFGDMPTGAIGRVRSVDRACGVTFICEAVARVVAWERVTVPAGTFDTVKVEVRQNWRPAAIAGPTSAQANGGRILLGWYAPAVKRAVKFSSRPTFGTFPPVDSNFDLELVSYQIK